MAATPPICEFGWKAVDFSLQGIDGRTYSLKEVAGPKGTVIVFMCNHCPYVRSIASRLAEEARALQALGIGVAGINANDASTYPEDSFENMKAFARDHGIDFPYLVDPTQEIARAYEAVCTPDFYGFNKDLELQYRGRLDESKTTVVPDARRELYEAMKAVAETGRGPREQIASMGCSIKWKAA
ncbi:thioredoxin family protein [Pelagibius litoralis]|uniref:Thioredoxin family protein n=1 Tax=Pelagibius litoralis TaxID=374515 RepID=A0A967EZL8_9PROT|nr:thioredoxin family protein [Pelagibius litoralis]NIA70322.1 thioredoxin family protein [Pelagibius litoralis]